MPKKGDKVKISGTGTFWDGKSGSVEDAYGDGTYKVAIPFGDGLETLQDFDGTYIECLNDKGANPVKESRGLAESAPSASERASALADYLGIDVSEVEIETDPIDDNYILTPNDGGYYVFTEDEAEEWARDTIKYGLIPQGLEGFPKEFQKRILSEFVDWKAVEEAALAEYGVPYFIAYYDGKDRKLKSGLHAFRYT